MSLNCCNPTESVNIYIYIYIYIYIRLPHEMGLERRVTLLLRPLVPSYLPPQNVILGVPTSTPAAPRVPKNGFRNEVVSRLVFEWIWTQISSNLCYPNHSKIGPKFKSVSRLALKLIFASKTKDQCIFENTQIRQNAWTVVQKSTLRISEPIVKCRLHPARMWSSIFDAISVPKIHLKQTSFFDAVLVSKVFLNVTQKDPKMLCRNCGKRPWDPFGHIKPGSWSQRHLPSPSRRSFWPHMEAHWTLFSPSASCSDIIAGAILLVNHNAQLL